MKEFFGAVGIVLYPICDEGYKNLSMDRLKPKELYTHTYTHTQKPRYILFYVN